MTVVLQHKWAAVVGKVLGAGSQLEPFWKETSDVVLEPLLQLGLYQWVHVSLTSGTLWSHPHGRWLVVCQDLSEGVRVVGKGCYLHIWWHTSNSILYIYDLTVGKCEEQTAISEEELIHRSQWAREPRNRGVDFISDSQFLSDWPKSFACQE